MDQEKVKLIIRNIELLLDTLKAEVYQDKQVYRHNDIHPEETDYDEIFEDSDLDYK